MRLLAFFQVIVQNFFRPKAFLNNISDWLSEYGLVYDTSKTLMKTVFGYNAVAVGLTNVTFANKVQNPASEHFQISAIQVYDGANATLGATDWALGCSNALAKQGSLTIVNNGTEELINIPFTQFVPTTGDTGSVVLLLEKPIMWVAQTALTISAVFPTAPVTANYNMRVEIIGLKLS